MSKPSLTPPPYIEVHASSRQESKGSCICVFGVSIMLVFTIDFWTCLDDVVFSFLYFNRSASCLQILHYKKNIWE